MQRKITRRFLNGSPKVVLFLDFLSPEECDIVLKQSFDFERSKTGGINGKPGNVNDLRTSETYYDTKDSLFFIKQRMAILLSQIESKYDKMTFGHYEALQVQKYTKEQTYGYHYDCFNLPYNPKKLKNDRVATFIVYLNDDFTGGETDFNFLGMTIKPKKGMGLFFEYWEENEARLKTKHAGLPVEEGEKWIVTCWIRQNQTSSDDWTFEKTEEEKALEELGLTKIPY
jgi:prolyl 4-hydroxylase